MGILRTKRSDRRYRKLIAAGLLENDGCKLCQEIVIKKFKHWKILKTRFPWDRIAKVHHMIVPIRHITFEQLNRAEKKEYEIIKESYIQKNYETIAESTNKTKTIPTHFHLHLIVIKD
ncbi:MAG: hypothetical protein WAN61_02865 [Minisyncoccia bacterium]